MQAHRVFSNSVQSFARANEPVVLGEIFEPQTSVAIWCREPDSLVAGYFDAISNSFLGELRNVFSMDTLQEQLTQTLPDAENKDRAIEDIFLLSDMVTCLFDCKEVGIRLTPLKEAMCPRLHVDNIPVRLVTTYIGPGTEWLPNEYADITKLGKGARGLSDNESGIYRSADHIMQMNAFDVGLLKGSAWSAEHSAAIHRSCPVAPNQTLCC